jgi:hypothetical protein
VTNNFSVVELEAIGVRFSEHEGDRDGWTRISHRFVATKFHAKCDGVVSIRLYALRALEHIVELGWCRNAQDMEEVPVLHAENLLLGVAEIRPHEGDDIFSKFLPLLWPRTDISPNQTLCFHLCRFATNLFPRTGKNLTDGSRVAASSQPDLR